MDSQNLLVDEHPDWLAFLLLWLRLHKQVGKVLASLCFCSFKLLRNKTGADGWKPVQAGLIQDTWLLQDALRLLTANANGSEG